MAMYRCYNPRCSERLGLQPGFDFDCAKGGQCPKCGSTPGQTKQVGQTKDGRPILAARVAPIATVHYDPPDPRRPSGHLNSPACQPARGHFAGTHASGEPSAVTCVKCRATEAFKTVAAENPAFEVFEIPKEHRPEARAEGGCCG